MKIQYLVVWFCLYQTDLKWIGEPVKEDGKKKFYQSVKINEDQVHYSEIFFFFFFFFQKTGFDISYKFV